MAIGAGRPMLSEKITGSLGKLGMTNREFGMTQCTIAYFANHRFLEKMLIKNHG